MSAAITFVPTVSANNETDGSPGNNVVNGVETWSGSHTLVGNVTVPPGAMLKITGGTSITLAAGSALIVNGAICAGESSCGATEGGTIGFNWQAPADETQSTWCEDLEFSWDASCGEGIILNGYKSIGESHPPKNKIEPIAHINNIFAYSPNQNIAYIIPEYSV
mgnify:CR=1 FL=1